MLLYIENLPSPSFSRNSTLVRSMTGTSSILMSVDFSLAIEVELAVESVSEEALQLALMFYCFYVDLALVLLLII